MVKYWLTITVSAPQAVNVTSDIVAGIMHVDVILLHLTPSLLAHWRHSWCTLVPIMHTFILEWIIRASARRVRPGLMPRMGHCFLVIACRITGETAIDARFPSETPIDICNVVAL